MTALELHGLKKSFGRAEVIRGVDLDVKQGERHAIIGPNGAGKSTLFNLVTGRVSPTAGSVHLNGHEITGLPPHQVNRLGLSRSFQITNIFPRMSVFENIRCALLWPMGYRYAFWRLLHRERVLNDAADAVLKDLDMMDRRDLPAGALSYAEQRALEIGITIAGGADVILLDEPSAGMSHSETDGLVAMIREKSAGKTLVMIEHDMGVVFELADRVSVLVYGHIIASGPPAEVRQNPAVQEAYLGAHGTVLP